MLAKPLAPSHCSIWYLRGLPSAEENRKSSPIGLALLKLKKSLCNLTSRGKSASLAVEGRFAPSGVVKIYNEPDCCQAGYWAKALGDIIKHANNKRSNLGFIIMVPQKEFDLRCNLPKAVAKYNTLKMIITKGCVEIT